MFQMKTQEKSNQQQNNANYSKYLKKIHNKKKKQRLQSHKTKTIKSSSKRQIRKKEKSKINFFCSTWT